jgi:hypothetical protein
MATADELCVCEGEISHRANHEECVHTCITAVMRPPRRRQPHPTRDTLLLGATALAALVLAVVGFAFLRADVASGGGGTTTPPIVIPPPTVGVNATVLAAACAAACGANVTCPRQVALTGVVPSCTTCGVGLTLLAGGACSAVATACTATPWCSSADATTHLAPLHNALVQAAIEAAPGRNASYVTSVYPGNATTMLAASTWNATIAPLVGANTAITILNEYLTAKFGYLALGSSAGPVQWFDDQAGWWAASLASYQAGVGLYGTYVATLKTLPTTCHSRTWIANSTTGNCIGPM